MSEDKLNTAMVRGSRAQALLRDELLQESLAVLERDYIEAWKTSPARDTDGRERLWQAVNVVGKVRDHLVKVANDGKLAVAEIEMLAKADAAKKQR